MKRNQDLSHLLVEQDWPLELTPKQREELLKAKMARARVYRYLQTGNVRLLDEKEQTCQT